MSWRLQCAPDGVRIQFFWYVPGMYACHKMVKMIGKMRRLQGIEIWISSLDFSLLHKNRIWRTKQIIHGNLSVWRSLMTRKTLRKNESGPNYATAERLFFFTGGENWKTVVEITFRWIRITLLKVFSILPLNFSQYFVTLK